MSFASIFNPFAKNTALQMATQELAEARAALLASQSAKEWAEAQVGYNLARISRLEKSVVDLQKLEPFSKDLVFKVSSTDKKTYQASAIPGDVFTSVEVTTPATKPKVANAKPKGPSNRVIKTPFASDTIKFA